MSAAGRSRTGVSDRLGPIADLGRRYKVIAVEQLFTVFHDPPETGRVKVIGIYTSEELAEAAVERTRSLPGFADHPNGFRVERYDIDRDHWPRGFVTL